MDIKIDGIRKTTVTFNSLGLDRFANIGDVIVALSNDYAISDIISTHVLDDGIAIHYLWSEVIVH